MMTSHGFCGWDSLIHAGFDQRTSAAAFTPRSMIIHALVRKTE